MFLKRIDVMGFKSFADKTTLEFSPGITGVVGPNGSGKSNIADAIRWVLGEQSARSLRGSKMEDVIFAGTEKRRPINYGEVSLTLDNEDGHLGVPFTEVTVTRRVYRSGESEYSINQQSCRLRDIHELFMDSGLGREAYSIIGQGRIEEMLSTRPEDRRGPFEDAAGIVKYRSRRKESERRLDETSANLVRVDDILAELARQAGPLEKEAARASEYQALSEEWTALDISLLVHQIETLQERYSQASLGLTEAKERREVATAELASAESALASAKESASATREAESALQQQLLLTVEERERADGQIAVLEERLSNLQTTQADREKQREDVSREIQELELQNEKVHEELQSVTARLEVKKGELEAATLALDPTRRSSLAAEVSELNAELIEVHQQEATHRNQIRSLQESMGTSAQRERRLEEDRERLRGELEKLRAQRQDLASRQEELALTKAAAMSEINETTAQIRNLSQEEAGIGAAIAKLDTDGASIQSKLELLKELEEGYDGYTAGVRAVMQAADGGRLSGVHGALATLITVPKEHETAIETALGAAVQNIVVDGEEDARSAIDYLKRRQAGRATFMPLAVLKSRRVSQMEEAKLAEDPGFVGIASDLAHCSDNHRRAVEHVLGNVVVAKTLVDANRLAKLLGYRLRIVTLDGDVVNPGGIMSGGSLSRRGPGLLGRKRDREATEAALRELGTKRNAMFEQQKELRTEISNAQAAAREAQNHLSELQSQLAEIDGRLREGTVEVRAAEDRLQALEWESEQTKDAKASWEEKLQMANEALASSTLMRQQLEQNVAAKRAQLDEWEQSSAVMQEHLTGVRVELAKLEQETSALVARRKDAYTRLAGQRDRQTQLGSELERISQSIATSKEQLKGARELVLALVDNVDAKEAQLVTLRLQSADVNQMVQKAEKDARDAQMQVHSIEEALHRAEVFAERIDVELSHVLVRLGEQYHMSYDWAKANHPLAEPADQAHSRADSLRKKMQALAPVSLSAIDEWARLSERIEFLTREKVDLEQAKAQLLDVIAEIDDEMARRFSESFLQIRAEFEVAFRQLFQGGKADLQLTDPEHVLTSGIEVIAQPPGKKLQNLNLLSGGERALTAMALLFAILRVRPVPFCVLDEVEAALDEANVGRFAKQLRRFSGETQFIVITHRRGTMEEVDSLYGVTMQESGVSSLISVRLSNEEDIETA